MEKISQFVGKPVINIFDGVIEGYVKHTLVDRKLKKVNWICIFDDETEEEKLIDTKSVVGFEFDAVMIKNSAGTYQTTEVDTLDINPINYRVFKTNGEDCGKILDFDFDEKFNIQNIFLSKNTTFDKCNILKTGNNIIIQKSKQTDKLFCYGVKQPKELKDAKDIAVSVQKTQNNLTTLPSKMLTNGYGFLIGRKVGQNIFAENGSLIAKKQSVITTHIIDTASKNGKLNELTKYSLA